MSERLSEEGLADLIAAHDAYRVNDDGWTVCICGHVAADDDDDGSHARHVAAVITPHLADQAARLAAVEIPHGVALDKGSGIVCLCGEVCNAVMGRSPAPLMGGRADGMYEAVNAGTVFARHLRAVRAALNPNPSESKP